MTKPRHIVMGFMRDQPEICDHNLYRAECPVCEIATLRAKVAELEKSLHMIRNNAKSQIDGMNSMGVSDDAPERVAATWYYTEAHHTLLRR